MANKKWETKYEQLNQRSRWYSSALWHVPFTYLGLIGYGSVKLVDMVYPLNSLGFILLGIFSLSVFVHLSSLKFYELRAVRSLQKLEEEEEVLSTGATQWYLSFSFYIRLMILIASYLFIAHGVSLVKIEQCERVIVLHVSLLALTILYLIVILKNYYRIRDLVSEIRNASTYRKQKPNEQSHSDVEGENKNT